MSIFLHDYYIRFKTVQLALYTRRLIFQTIYYKNDRFKYERSCNFSERSVINIYGTSRIIPHLILLQVLHPAKAYFAVYEVSNFETVATTSELIVDIFLPYYIIYASLFSKTNMH
ncbi:hypothetical protein PUN28_001373 [Cardiocondyla obscurior]|uniref:Uncharacterized protein n=1 Tax=Cardiocondyla obscurior TaxID=286306 RepID=A0AAW2H4P0_9HYME